MKRVLGLLLTVTLFGFLQSEPKEVDVAFVVDCSASMTFSLDDAKKKIEELVVQVQKEHPNDRLKIGFIQYGDGTTHYTRFDLTSDMDAAYRFFRRFNADIGTKEFPGYFIEAATQVLTWGKDAERIIYVVGNETPHQGPEGYDYTETVPFAAEHGYRINSVFAGYGGKARSAEVEKRVEKELKEWAEIASLGKGSFITLYPSKR